jgi:hypothetical protein
MRRARRAIIAAAVGLALVATGCGGDDDPIIPGAGGDDRDPGDVDPGDLGGDDPVVSIGNIPGVSGECEDLYSAYLTLFSVIGTPGASSDELQPRIDALQSQLPDDLRDDAEVLATALQDYLTVLDEAGSDADVASNPEVLAALQALGTPEVAAASTNIGQYFEQTCPPAG